MTGLGLRQRWLPSSPLPPGRPEGRERSEPLAPQRSQAGAHGWEAAPRFSEAGRPLGTQEKHLCRGYTHAGILRLGPVTRQERGAAVKLAFLGSPTPAGGGREEGEGLCAERGVWLEQLLGNRPCRQGVEPRGREAAGRRRRQ